MGIAGSMQEAMAANMEKQQAAMKQMQIEMAMRQRQTQLAMQVALQRERFYYYSVFASILYTILPIAAIKNKKPQLMFPLLPISIAWAF